MAPIRIIKFTVFFFFSLTLFSQNRIYLDDGQIIRYGIEADSEMESEVYIFEQKLSITRIVDEILEVGGGKVKNFQIYSSTVEGILCYVNQDTRYILYSEEYINSIASKAELYGVFSNVIGHHVYEHSLDLNDRLMEESESILFTGYVLSKIEGINKSDLSLVARLISLAGFDEEIILEQIRVGWKQGAMELRINENLGFYEENGVKLDDLPILTFRPTPCPQYSDLLRLQNGFEELDDIDQYLVKCLRSRGYGNRKKYYHMPNGFAIVTQLEQLDKEGMPLPGANRWKDYPIRRNVNGLIDIAKSFFADEHQIFRFFVFIVSDEAITEEEKETTSINIAKGWLSSGYNIIPGVVSEIKITKKHYLQVLVYEFKGSHTNKKVNMNCNPNFSFYKHLDGSGLSECIKLDE